MIDLSPYAQMISEEEDRPLFLEAVEAVKVNALRAAYVMIWLACAESFKRRFREAQKRDSAAGKIVGDIVKKENEQKAVDKFILDKSLEYGFLSTTGHRALNHVYEMRCLYVHPYESAPSPEQVMHAAAVVVDHVLSHPVKLRHGFGTQLLYRLINDLNFLDDQQSAVKTFVKDIIPRIDNAIYAWFLEEYWKKLEPIANDPLLLVYFRRGEWFCQAMLSEVGVGVFTHNDWHDKVSQYPKTLIFVCVGIDVFPLIGERAQDSLVGVILSEANTRASILKHLEILVERNVE